MAIGILALQGAFAEHETMLDRLGAEWFEIRQKRDLEKPLDGLILPGGESTVMGKLLRDLDLFETLQEKIRAGLPVYGTCAGLILLADQVEGGIPCFATMDLTAKRNAYGRQLGSFTALGRWLPDAPDASDLPMTFIRAPRIVQVEPGVEVLVRVENTPTAVRYGNQIACAFHPELDSDTRIHRMFTEM